MSRFWILGLACLPLFDSAAERSAFGVRDIGLEYTQSPQVFDLYAVLSKKGEQQLEEIAAALDHRYGRSEALSAALEVGFDLPARIESELRVGLALRAQATNPVIPHFRAALFEGALLRSSREFVLEEELAVTPTLSFLGGREQYVDRVSTDLLDTAKVVGAGAFGIGAGARGAWRRGNVYLRGNFHSTGLWHGAEQIRGAATFTTWDLDVSWARRVRGWRFQACGGLSNSALCDLPGFEALEELHVYYGRFESLQQVLGGAGDVSWSNGTVEPGLKFGWHEGSWQAELHLRGGGHEVRLGSVFRSTGAYFKDATGRQYRLSWNYFF